MSSSNSILIRALRPDDRSAFQALVRSTLREHFADRLPANELEQCVIDYQRFDAPCYVADVEGTLVGYAVAGSPAARSTTATESAVGQPVERLYLTHATDDGILPLTSDLAPDWSIDRPIASALVRAVTGPVETDALVMYDRWGFVDTKVVGRCLSLPSGQGRLL